MASVDTVTTIKLASCIVTYLITSAIINIIFLAVRRTGEDTIWAIELTNGNITCFVAYTISNFCFRAFGRTVYLTVTVTTIIVAFGSITYFIAIVVSYPFRITTTRTSSIAIPTIKRAQLVIAFLITGAIADPPCGAV